MIRTKLTAHRGAAYCFPENTLDAFDQAVRDGAERIEFDLHMTLDRKLVIHHDYYPENSTHPIHKVTLSDLLSINSSIPSLEQVLEVIPSNIELEIEMKGFTSEFIESALDAIDERRDVEFTSPHAAVLDTIRAVRPAAVLGLFVATFPSWMPSELGRDILFSTVELQKINVAHLPLSMIDEEVIDRAEESGVRVHAANCNSRSCLERAFALNVHQLSTDVLPLAHEVRKGCSEIEGGSRCTTPYGNAP